MRTQRTIGLVALVLWAATAHAQTDPLSLPLAQPSDFGTPKKWTYPTDDGRRLPGTASALTWNGGLAGLSSGGRFYARCHEHMARVAEVQPPAGLSGMGTVTGPCADVDHLWSVDPAGGSVGGSLRIGGALAWNGRTIVAAHVYYGGTTAVGSHFVGTSHTAMHSPVNTLKSPTPGVTPAMFSSNGGMTPIPQEWRALLGGPVLVGGCCQAVVSRSGYGPSVHVFDPDALPLAGGGTVPARTLIAFPQAHQTLGAWDGPDVGGYNMNSMQGFTFIVPGSRTLAVVGGRGGSYCYGKGTDNQALVGTPDGTGTNYCFDPTDFNRGGHGYPYLNAVWLWDLKAVLAAKNPWDTKPYYYGSIPSLAGIKGRVVGGVFDASTNTAHMTMGTADGPMEVHALKVAVGNAPPPPTPIDCQGVWSESLSEPTPLVCDATQVQTRTRTKTFTVTTPASNGGAACPASPVVTTEKSSCVWTPPPPPPVPKFIGAIRAQEQLKSGVLRVTLEVPKAMAIPAKGAKVDVPLPAGVVAHGTVYAVGTYASGNWRVTIELPATSALTLGVEMPVVAGQ